MACGTFCGDSINGRTISSYLRLLAIKSFNLSLIPRSAESGRVSPGREVLGLTVAWGAAVSFRTAVPPAVVIDGWSW